MLIKHKGFTSLSYPYRHFILNVAKKSSALIFSLRAYWSTLLVSISSMSENGEAMVAYCYISFSHAALCCAGWRPWPATCAPMISIRFLLARPWTSHLPECSGGRCEIPASFCLI